MCGHGSRGVTPSWLRPMKRPHRSLHYRWRQSILVYADADLSREHSSVTDVGERRAGPPAKPGYRFTGGPVSVPESSSPSERVYDNDDDYDDSTWDMGDAVTARKGDDDLRPGRRGSPSFPWVPLSPRQTVTTVTATLGPCGDSMGDSKVTVRRFRPLLSPPSSPRSATVGVG